MSALACYTRNVLGKGGRPYLSVRKKWESLDGGGWCRHDPAIPYQTCPPPAQVCQVGKPVGLHSDAHSGHDRRHQLGDVQGGRERRVLRPRPGLQWSWRHFGLFAGRTFEPPFPSTRVRDRGGKWVSNTRPRDLVWLHFSLTVHPRRKEVQMVGPVAHYVCQTQPSPPLSLPPCLATSMIRRAG